eukprot:332155_1
MSDPLRYEDSCPIEYVCQTHFRVHCSECDQIRVRRVKYWVLRYNLSSQIQREDFPRDSMLFAKRVRPDRHWTRKDLGQNESPEFLNELWKSDSLDNVCLQPLNLSRARISVSPQFTPRPGYVSSTSRSSASSNEFRFSSDSFGDLSEAKPDPKRIVQSRIIATSSDLSCQSEDFRSPKVRRKRS